MDNPFIETQEVLLLPQEEEAKPPLQIKLFKGQIILNPAISKLNFITYMLYSVYLGVVLLPVSLLQNPLFSIVYQLTPSEQDTLNSASQLSILLIKSLVSSWIGYICDQFGRKPLIVVGVVLIGLGTFSLPLLPSVYPYYILAQIVIEVGLLCVTIPPLLADYIDYDTKGRVAGLGALMLNLTYFCVTFIQSEDKSLQSDITFKFYEFGGVAFIIGIFLMIGLKGGKYHKNLLVDKKAEEARRSLLEEEKQEVQEASKLSLIFKESTEYSSQKESSSLSSLQMDSLQALKQSSPIKEGSSDHIVVEEDQLGTNKIPHIKDEQNSGICVPSINMIRKKEQKPGFIAGVKEARNPWILIGFMCMLLGMANVDLLGYIFVSYIAHLDGGENATNQAYFLVNKRLVVGIFTSLFVGFSSDKYNKWKQIVFLVLSSTIATILLILTPSPYHFMAYMSMVLFGIAISGYFTFGMQLVSKYPNPKYRASVNAVSGIVTVLGSASVSIIGLYLRQYTGCYLLPFYIFLGWTTFGLTLLIVLYISKREILNKL